MKLVQFVDPQDREGGGLHVGLVQGKEIIDLTQAPPGPRTVYDLYYQAGGDQDGLVQAVGRVRDRATGARRLGLDELLDNRDRERPHLTKPVSGPAGQPHALRLWLAGVTHEVSAKLREIEARQATGEAVNVYDQKYREVAKGGRPELFSKGEPEAVVGHGQPIARPADTLRLVPETELVTVYGLNRKGKVERLGYTGGNDVTDNGIEAANPLNLPQAKNWAGGCASLGPLLVTADEYDDAEVAVSCQILRQGKSIGFKEGRTGQNHLNMPDRLRHLERFLFRRMPLEPRLLLAFYWGTPIVFAEKDFPGGLLAGDLMRLSFSGGIGVLENPIAPLPEIDQL
jgi:fumarylacetoacetate (FAA) hydrolase family protein